jgi:hypothetical protein
MPSQGLQIILSLKKKGIIFKDFLKGLIINYMNCLMENKFL